MFTVIWRSLALLAASVFCAFGQADWPTWAGGPQGTRYSSLSQINRDNVGQLQVAWTYDTEDAFAGSEIECTPIVVNGVLYATTPKARLFALNAATGKELWSFDPAAGRRVGKYRLRGIAYSDGKIYFPFQQFLYAIDAATGKPVAGFGNAGRIDLRRDLGRDYRELSVSMTSPVAVYKDLVIAGSIVSETLPSAPGDIRAYDARTGALRWTFHTIPHPGEPGYESWPKDAWTFIGGANNWTGMTVDADRGLVFVPTGSAAFDFFGANRAGDNLYANSLLALDAATGKRVWHFQTVRHDIWDRDLPAPPALVRVMRDGKAVDAVAQTTKSGFVYVFDRATGKPLFPVESRRYPASDAPGERAAATQPLPVQPPPFARQRLTEDLLTDRTPEAHAEVLERFRKLRSAGQFAPPSLEGTIVFPGFDGGAEWGGAAFDAQTGLLYVNANEMAWVLRLVERKANASASSTSGKELYAAQCASCHRPDRRGSPPEFPSLEKIADNMTETEVLGVVRQGAGRMPSFASLPADQLRAVVRFVYYGVDASALASAASPGDQRFGIDGYNKFLDRDGYPAVKPPWGTLSAVDLNAGKIAWQVPLGEYPELSLKNTGSENYGGPVVTAGGLVFIAATNFDNKIRAFDKATGKLLWESRLPAAGNATPAVFEVNGREYITIACGGGKSKMPPGGSYVTFVLPQP